MLVIHLQSGLLLRLRKRIRNWNQLTSFHPARVTHDCKMPVEEPISSPRGEAFLTVLFSSMWILSSSLKKVPPTNLYLSLRGFILLQQCIFAFLFIFTVISLLHLLMFKWLEPWKSCSHGAMSPVSLFPFRIWGSRLRRHTRVRVTLDISG